MAGAVPAPYGDPLTRERPWLLPSNRKVRHLTGLGLRNLQLTRPASGTAGKAIDDESVPSALKTTAKALAQSQVPTLEHSRSSGDLTKAAKVTAPGKSRRNAPKAFRRRSTLNWADATPEKRQEELESIAAERLATVWFSVHVPDVAEPAYVSEQVDGALNPVFRQFDLDAFSSFVTRKDEVTIRFWAKTRDLDDFELLIEAVVNLSSLQFLGRSLDGFNHPLPQNTILFYLSDGIYTSFTNLPCQPTSYIIPSSKQNDSLQTTASFDTLMRLSNLDACIQDALSTRQSLLTQINTLLHSQHTYRSTLSASSQASERLSRTQTATTTCQSQLRSLKTRLSQLQSSLSARRTGIISGITLQHNASHELSAINSLQTSTRLTLQTTQSHLAGQIRRIGEDLSTIYPIHPISSGSLSFSIASLPLGTGTSTALSEPDSILTAAALGHAAHLTHLLSLYLSIPLPYPISPRGSTSTIYDPISLTLPSHASRTFPLYAKGAAAYRFEYALFLLNSDIELLMSRRGARLVDLRYTLGNLKYVLAVVTVGSGEVPGRKRGVIKAALENGSVKQGSRSSSRAGTFSRRGGGLAAAAT